MAQNAPTLASSRRSNDEGPQFMRAEAIAMRRIIAERGWWLSPLHVNVPVPALTQWEASVELAKVDHNHTTRERQHRNRKGERHRNFATPTVLDVTIGRTKTPATVGNLQARKAHRANVEQVAQAQGKSPADVDREIAIARVTAIAAQKAAAHKIAEARKARLAAAEAKRKDRNDNPAEVDAKRKAKNQREAERKQKQRAAARSGAAACPSIVAEVVDAAEATAFRMKRKQGKQAAAQKPQGGAATWTGRPMHNPHRDPTLPTAKMLREEAIRAEAIEAEERRLTKIMKAEGRRVTSECNLHPSKK